jgi:hypothetical protein
MAFSTIDKSSVLQNAVLYTGNYATNAITGVGFSPDLVWAKERGGTSSHALFDTVRGVQKKIMPNNGDVESTETNYLSSFDSDGWTTGANNGINQDGITNVGWQWKAGTTTGITQGSATITPASYSFNATSGFSIIKWVGTGANATIPHGLGAVPKLIIVKNLDSIYNWNVYHASMGNTKNLVLNEAEDEETQTYWQDTTPDATLFYVNDASTVNESGVDMIAYCFAEISGYSKFSSYTGNGSADGQFVQTNFKPSFLITKGNIVNGLNWFMADNKRSTSGGYNVNNRQLYCNLGNADDTNADVDFLSNGFKWLRDGGDINSSGRNYVYIAFGQPMISNSGT